MPPKQVIKSYLSLTPTQLRACLKKENVAYDESDKKSQLKKKLRDHLNTIGIEIRDFNWNVKTLQMVPRQIDDEEDDDKDSNSDLSDDDKGLKKTGKKEKDQKAKKRRLDSENSTDEKIKKKKSKTKRTSQMTANDLKECLKQNKAQYQDSFSKTQLKKALDSLSLPKFVWNTETKEMIFTSEKESNSDNESEDSKTQDDEEVKITTIPQDDTEQKGKQNSSEVQKISAEVSKVGVKEEDLNKNKIDQNENSLKDNAHQDVIVQKSTPTEELNQIGNGERKNERKKKTKKDKKDKKEKKEKEVRDLTVKQERPLKDFSELGKQKRVFKEVSSESDTKGGGLFSPYPWKDTSGKLFTIFENKDTIEHRCGPYVPKNVLKEVVVPQNKLDKLFGAGNPNSAIDMSRILRIDNTRAWKGLTGKGARVLMNIDPDYICQEEHVVDASRKAKVSVGYPKYFSKFRTGRMEEDGDIFRYCVEPLTHQYSACVFSRFLKMVTENAPGQINHIRRCMSDAIADINTDEMEDSNDRAIITGAEVAMDAWDAVEIVEQAEDLHLAAEVENKTANDGDDTKEAEVVEQVEDLHLAAEVENKTANDGDKKSSESKQLAAEVENKTARDGDEKSSESKQLEADMENKTARDGDETSSESKQLEADVENKTDNDGEKKSSESKPPYVKNKTPNDGEKEIDGKETT